MIPARPPSPEAQELLARVRRLRIRTRLVACAGVILAAGGVAAILASGDGLPVLAALLPVGLAIALLAERRLARLSSAERRVSLGGAGDLTPTALLAGLGWSIIGHDSGSGGACGGFDGGGGDGGGGGGDGGC